MKKIMRILAAVCSAVLVAAGTAMPASATRLLKGDVNGDGNITLRDATLTQKIQLNLKSPSEDERYAADMDGNSSVTLADAYLVQRLASHDSEIMTGSDATGGVAFCPARKSRLDFYNKVNELRESLGLPAVEITDGMLAAGQELADAYYTENVEENTDSYSGYRVITNGSGSYYTAAFDDYCLPAYTGSSNVACRKGTTMTGATLYNNMISQKETDSTMGMMYSIVTQANLRCLCVGVHNTGKGSYWLVTGY